MNPAATIRVDDQKNRAHNYQTHPRVAPGHIITTKTEQEPLVGQSLPIHCVGDGNRRKQRQLEPLVGERVPTRCVIDGNRRNQRQTERSDEQTQQRTNSDVTRIVQAQYDSR